MIGDGLQLSTSGIGMGNGIGVAFCNRPKLLPLHPADVLALVVVEVPREEIPVLRSAPDLGKLIRNEMHHAIGLALVPMVSSDHDTTEFVEIEFAGLLVDCDARLVSVALGKGEHHSQVD